MPTPVNSPIPVPDALASANSPDNVALEYRYPAFGVAPPFVKVTASPAVVFVNVPVPVTARPVEDAVAMVFPPTNNAETVALQANHCPPRLLKSIGMR